MDRYTSVSWSRILVTQVGKLSRLVKLWVEVVAKRDITMHLSETEAIKQRILHGHFRTQQPWKDISNTVESQTPKW